MAINSTEVFNPLNIKKLTIDLNQVTDFKISLSTNANVKASIEFLVKDTEQYYELMNILRSREHV